MYKYIKLCEYINFVKYIYNYVNIKICNIYNYIKSVTYIYISTMLTRIIDYSIIRKTLLKLVNTYIENLVKRKKSITVNL